MGLFNSDSINTGREYITTLQIIMALVYIIYTHTTSDCFSFLSSGVS